MPISLQKVWNSSAVKSVPLFLCGTPKRNMMHLMKFTAVEAVEMVMGTASIHLVTLSTVMRRWVLMTHKCRGSQQSSRVRITQFIDSTQGEPKDIYKL